MLSLILMPIVTVAPFNLVSSLVMKCRPATDATGALRDGLVDQARLIKARDKPKLYFVRVAGFPHGFSEPSHIPLVDQRSCSDLRMSMYVHLLRTCG